MHLQNHINQSGKHFLIEVSQYIQQQHTRKINHLDVKGVDTPYLYLLTYNQKHQVEIIVSLQIINFESAKIAITVNQKTNLWFVQPFQLDAEDIAKTIMAFCC